MIIVRRLVSFDGSIRNVSAIEGVLVGGEWSRTCEDSLSHISREERFKSRLALTHAWSIHHQQAEQSYRWLWNAVRVCEVLRGGMKTSTVFGFEQPLAGVYACV